TRRQYKPRAPRQLSISLLKNDGARSEIRDRHDAKSDRWPKKQDPPWPKNRARNQENRCSSRVIRTDAAIRNNRQRERTFAKEIEAISGQNKSADDVDQVVLIRENWRQRDQNEPSHNRNTNKTARVTKINFAKN